MNLIINNNHKNQWSFVVSDLTYVQGGAKWHYLCLLINLFNREIIGYNIETNKIV
ncbi:hypothetical protein [Spiroplasma endosymbiont of Polydrusus formosus]|uniref:hypothetical protein n=1 Tax=Spiroplasma endosymbiont of Polydrusus formosus TaxID=3139326 RepID=UPI0035B52DEB